MERHFSDFNLYIKRLQVMQYILRLDTSKKFKQKQLMRHFVHSVLNGLKLTVIAFGL